MVRVQGYVGFSSRLVGCDSVVCFDTGLVWILYRFGMGLVLVWEVKQDSEKVLNTYGTGQSE